MGPFLTQPNPTHQLTDQNQPDSRYRHNNVTPNRFKMGILISKLHLIFLVAPRKLYST